MWPPQILEVLVGLADTQEYDSLWELVLRLSFPEDLGFQVAGARAGEDPDFASRCRRVFHPDHGDFFLLTWSSPSYNPDYQPFFNDTNVNTSSTFTRRLVHRIHAAGTSIRCTHMRRDGGPDTQPVRYVSGFPDSFIRIPVADIFEPPGFEDFVKTCRLAREDVNIPWDILDLEREVKRNWDTLVRLLPPTPMDRTNSEVSSNRVYLEHASDTPRNHQSPRLPWDVLAIVADLCDRQDLLALAVVNSFFNHLTNRTIWESFGLYGDDDLDGSEVFDARLSALLRLPHRSHQTKRLFFDLVTWKWSHSLIQKLEQMWHVLPQLTQLELTGMVDNDTPLQGGEYSPILRSFLKCSAPIHLLYFEFHDSVAPNLLVEQFLRMQPSIEHFEFSICWQPWVSHLNMKGLLPNLKATSCDVEVAEQLLQEERRIRYLQTFTNDVRPTFRDAMAIGGKHLRCFDFGPCAEKGQELLQIVQSAPNLRFMNRLRGDEVDPESGRTIISSFRFLEDWVCSSSFVYETEDPLEFGQWASQLGSSILRIFYSSMTTNSVVWERVQPNNSPAVWKRTPKTSVEISALIASRILHHWKGRD